MPNYHLDKLSAKELSDLEAKVKKAIAGARERERSGVKQKIDAIMSSAGITIEDVVDLYGFSRGRGVRKGTKVAPKYRNPDNKNETWTGRGRQPRWLTAKLGKGGKLADFAI